ncbi:MAG TPA: hypothetical protein VMT22_09600 [Terriglobales bacterium]|nr:hypothetical protein [Terriglobales bacterium]
MISLILFVLAAANSVQTSELPPQRPMNEMHGDCSNYHWNLSKELSLSARAPTSLASQARPEHLPPADVDRPYAVVLQPQTSVTFATKPGEDRGGPAKFSGLLAFTPPTDGIYRISASTGLWIDVVESGSLVPSAAHEMQTGCKTIFKSVAYRLKGGSPLIVQFNGSPNEIVRMLITEWPAVSGKPQN